MTIKEVCIYPGLEAAGVLVWRALTHLVPVHFRGIADLKEAGSADAVILLAGDLGDLARAVRDTKRVFYVDRSGPRVMSPHPCSKVSLARSGTLDFRLRGRNLGHSPIPEFRELPSTEAEILAWFDDSPVWTHRRVGDTWVDTVGVPLPTLGNGEYPFDFFRADQFIQLLPVLHFLRQVVNGAGWQPPPLRACFMFDDPNLHSSTYGFLPFADLVRLARSFSFHVAFATVPFDTWYVHAPVASLFRDAREYISLLVHGNNHLRAELAWPEAYQDQLRLLAQALRRVDRFERNCGLHVCKVMAPPHSAYHQHALNAMLALGYHGAYISPWSLRDWGMGRRWASTFGLTPAEIMDGGFPVVPRFRLHSGCENEIVISAFLDRPIVLVGHHDSVADGLEILCRLAQIINSLGPVIWSDTEAILESNYLTHRSDGCLHVCPYSAKFAVNVPDGVESILLHSPADATGPLTFRASQPHLAGYQQVLSGHPIPVVPGRTVRFQLRDLGTLHYRNQPAPAFSAWAVTRRIICEARDRAVPLLSSFTKLDKTGSSVTITKATNRGMN